MRMEHAIENPVRRSALSGYEFAAYFVASAVALAVDLSVLFVVVPIAHYLVAVSCGFLAGAIANYVMSTRWVFRYRRMGDRARTEFAVFVIVGLFGLAISNTVVFAAVEILSLTLGVGKFLAAGASFLFGFVFRKWILFR